MSEPVQIVDVAPRDGLQSQPRHMDTASKLELIRRLVDAGIRRLEVASFVNPERVPKMADAEAVVRGLPGRADVSYIGLVLNLRGYDRAVACGIGEINCVVVATDSFGLRNQGADIEKTMKTAAQIGARARQDRIAASVTISTAFGCPFEGEVPSSRIVELVARLRDMGFEEVALADTIGAAGPSDVSTMLRAVEKERGSMRLRCHFHNTRDTGVANAYAAVLEGVRVLDASCGGLGGCPFAPNATGNVATEDVLYMLQRMGMETGVDIRGIMETARWLGAALDTPMPAMVTRAGLFPPEAGTGTAGKGG